MKLGPLALSQDQSWHHDIIEGGKSTETKLAVAISAVWGPFVRPPNPPEKVHAGHFLLSFPGNGAHKFQPAPKYHTKGCSHLSVDSPRARTLVFAAGEPFLAANFGNTLLCDTLAP